VDRLKLLRYKLEVCSTEEEREWIRSLIKKELDDIELGVYGALDNP
jgi:hypothetical protein